MAKKKKKAKKTKNVDKKKRSGKKSTMSGKLKELQKGWKKAKPRVIGAPVPDNGYVTRIESAVIDESKSSKRLQVDWTLEIVEGDYAGRKIHKYSGLESSDNLDFLQGDLETLEVAVPESIGDLGEALEKVAGMLIEINVRTKDEFTNVDFIEILDDEASEEDDEEDDDDDSDDDDDDNDDDDASEDDDDEEEEEDKEDEEEDEEEDDDEDELTKSDIKKMNSSELKELIEEYELKTNPKDKKNKSITKLRAAVIKELF